MSNGSRKSNCCSAPPITAKATSENSNRPKVTQPAQVHREQRARRLLDRRRGLARSGGDLAALARAHGLAQRLGFGRVDVADGDLVLAAGAGLELDLDHAEQPRDQRLLEADVLDPLVRHRARGAAEQAALDADVAIADAVLEMTPADVSEQRAEQDHQCDRGEDEYPPPPHPCEPKSTAATGNSRLRRPVIAPTTKLRGLVRRHSSGRGGRLAGHIVSRLTCARISSRIAAASAWASPGSVTDALCVPAVCSTSVARP